MFTHNIKIAIRNLMKYKTQNVISVLSIAIGIVSLTFTNVLTSRFKLPAICSEPYYDRVYSIQFDSLDQQTEPKAWYDPSIWNALESNGGLRCTDGNLYAPNNSSTGSDLSFRLADGTVRRYLMSYSNMSPSSLNYAGIHSSITGKKIKVMKRGEAVINSGNVKKIFGNHNPVGATVTLTNFATQQRETYTIVDVYDDNFSVSERGIGSNNELYYSSTSPGEELPANYSIYSLDVILKEGGTPEQLKKEVDARLRPLGLESHIKKLSDIMSNSIDSMRNIRLIINTIGALILFISIIGFLRMQIQLFWMRQHEIAIRIMNGAKRTQLFATLTTEVLVSIIASIIVALLMDAWLYDFLMTNFEGHYDFVLRTDTMYTYSLQIGLFLIVVCGIIVWLLLRRIYSKGWGGLSAAMKNSRTHYFRNIMLGVQVTISMIFVCSTLTLCFWSSKIADMYHIPDDESDFKASVYVDRRVGTDITALHDSLTILPDLKLCIPYGTTYSTIADLTGRQDIEVSFNSNTVSEYPQHFEIVMTADTAFINFWNLDVKWLDRDIDRSQCVLIQEDAYKQLRDHGFPCDYFLFPDTAQVEAKPIQVAGTFKRFPYVKDDTFHNMMSHIIVIRPMYDIDISEFILIPKPGKYKALMSETQSLVSRLDPETVDQTVWNLRSNKASDFLIIEAARTGAMVLALVSLIICASGILSTITLDTRTRRKEMVIRKINGAKARDIGKIFGRTYAAIIIVAAIVCIPVSYIFFNMINEDNDLAEKISSGTGLMITGAGICLVILIIFIIVSWQIHQIMRVQPSEIIVKQ